MKRRIRLLPLVLIAVSALLAVKVLGFVMGVEPFGVGPLPAVASGDGAAGHGEAAAPAPAAPDTSAVDRLTAPINLSDEYKKLKEEQDKAAAGHAAAPADGAAHGAAPAADAAHGATPADAKPTDAKPTGGAAPAADAAHGAASAGAKPSGDATPAADATHNAAPADGKPAAAGVTGGAPATDAQAKSAEGGHGAKTKTDVYTERPKEYAPPIGSSERAILEGLAVRRDELDKRAQDLDLRAKLLEAAEKRLNDRLNQLQSIETQLGVAGGGAPTAAAPATASGSPIPASPASASPPASTASGTAAGTPAPAGTPPAMNEQLAALVALYEGMKPKAAAAVFDKLDTGTLLELADHMNPRKLSPIIATMDPDKASRITSLMMGAQQAQKRVVVQVEQMAPALGPVSAGGGAAPVDASQLPQIMPAQPGR